VGLEPRLQLICADAQTLPLQAATFDRVLCSGVLYHVPDCHKAVAEIRRVLRPGGLGDFDQRRQYDGHVLNEVYAGAACALVKVDPAER
jgi:ubiquinone/menaquinone biosynthesis C-methylase UbiE